MTDRGETPLRDRIDVERAGPGDMDACFALRHRVFVLEQGVPVALERDAEDADATHWLARLDGRLVGTARCRAAGRHARAERVAVVSEARGAGIGRALMAAIEHWARAAGLGAVVLHAQTDAIPFYEALGYETEGDVFEEAGIPHQQMRKPVDESSRDPGDAIGGGPGSR